MNVLLWLLVLAILACLPRFFARTGRPAHRLLPRDFDFDVYKTRELNLRGLFDKTTWTR
ncbi:hypothetical protein K9F62_00045 [Desulfovibrio sp. JY]|nr:hypothetical protein K9F62_00045 [Desulfovibrio sp. JY]